MFYIIRVKYYLLKMLIASSENLRCVFYRIHKLLKLLIDDAFRIDNKLKTTGFPISLLISQHEAN